MKILYIFPHPDDESFGPAGAINKQVKKGDEVYLLTLTKGGATRVRHKLEKSIKEMGQIREKEMLKVKSTLGIKEMHILDFEDGGLAKLNPLELEDLVKSWVVKIKPNVIVTYPIHGGSGHHDHIALFAAVNHVYYSLKPTSKYLKRLALFTLPDSGDSIFMENGTPRVTWSPKERIGAIIALDENDLNAMKNALLCYETYQEMVKKTNVINRIGDKVYFELAGEYNYKEPLQSLTADLSY